MNTKYFLSIPCAGLCARIQHLISSMAAAEKLNRKLIVKWINQQNHFCGPFNSLFKNAFDLDYTKCESLKTKLINVNSHYINIDDIEEYDVLEIFGYSLFTCISKKEDNILTFSPMFWQNVRPYLLKLVPINEIQYYINMVSFYFNEYTIGVHVRKTDNEVAMKYAKDKLFYSEIDSLIKKRPNLNIYLAADSFETVKKYKLKYGRRILVFDDFLSSEMPRDRNSALATQFSMIELYLLSRTKIILKSIYSSFGYISAIIGGIPFKEIRDFTHFVFKSNKKWNIPYISDITGKKNFEAWNFLYNY